MKKFMILSVVLFVAIGANAQSIKKQIKQLEKEGWYVSPGKNMEKMLENSIALQEEKMKDSSGFEINRYIEGNGNSKSYSKNVAHSQALSAAINKITTQIKTDVDIYTKTALGNAQINADIATIDQITSNSVQTSSQTLSMLTPVIDMYRPYKEDGKEMYEMQVVIYYDKTTMLKVAKNEMIKTLQKQLEGNEEELKKLSRIK